MSVVQSKFKAYQIITASSPGALSLQITAMVAEGGWQLFGPPQVTKDEDKALFSQALLLFEIVKAEKKEETQQ